MATSDQENMQTFSSRAVRMPRSGIREVMDVAWATKNAIRLEAGEPDFGTPSHIVEAAIRALRAGHTKYIPNAGLGDLRGAAPRFFERKTGSLTGNRQGQGGGHRPCGK